MAGLSCYSVNLNESNTFGTNKEEITLIFTRKSLDSTNDTQYQY